jgi:hypothetical protein
VPILKVAVVFPTRTITKGGIVNTEVFAVSVTKLPPAPAAWSSVTVAVTVCPPAMLLGLSVSVLILGVVVPGVVVLGAEYPQAASRPARTTTTLSNAKRWTRTMHTPPK